MQVFVSSDDLALVEASAPDDRSGDAASVAVSPSVSAVRTQLESGEAAYVIPCACRSRGHGRSASEQAEELRGILKILRVTAEDAGTEGKAVPTGDTSSDSATAFGADSRAMLSSSSVTMEREINQALERNEFELFLQPQIDLRDFSIFGAEVLLRWRHPELGIVAPGEFLPVAEASGQICPIGRWVLGTVCANYGEWKQWLGAGGTLAVNVSAAEFKDHRFLGNTLAILGNHQVPGGAVELELTETVLMADPAGARESLECLRRNGVRVALDDFGVGYSCLASLRDLPFSRIKIDRSFVHSISTSNRSRTIVRSMIELAQGIHVEVTAEGVETAEQLRLLYEYGCEQVQGYLFARPMPVARFAAWAKGYSGNREQSAPSRGASEPQTPHLRQSCGHHLAKVVEFAPRAVAH